MNFGLSGPMWESRLDRLKDRDEIKVVEHRDMELNELLGN